jgi:hypothetical protein
MGHLEKGTTVKTAAWFYTLHPVLKVIIEQLEKCGAEI